MNDTVERLLLNLVKYNRSTPELLGLWRAARDEWQRIDTDGYGVIVAGYNAKIRFLERYMVLDE